ncbi:FadR/GntR family transcriptional regulator [Microbacterium sp. LWH3-1.2]|uniref:FadR/GntR family transcriptional regulator n=1 Tax=Microbacterium sp. LWH3-1.2 TaxID=3135256 RepID=UPI00343D26A0
MVDPKPLQTFPAVRPVSASRLADEVVEQIRNIILKNDLSEGTRLPSERDLASQLGASRPIIAQALRTLSMMGLVDIRPGSGAYVMRRPEHLIAQSMQLMMEVDGDSLDHLLDLRLLLEDRGAALAITGATETDLGKVHRALDRMTNAASASSWVAADAVFHVALVRAGQNEYLAAMFEAVHTTAVSNTYRTWIESGKAPSWLFVSRDRPDEVHVAMLDALQRGDAVAMHEHVLAHHEAMLSHLRGSS